jgi:hypothetical protein
MTFRAASATKDDSISSEPYCLDAIAGLRAVRSAATVNFLGSVWIESAE